MRSGLVLKIIRGVAVIMIGGVGVDLIYVIDNIHHRRTDIVDNTSVG